MSRGGAAGGEAAAPRALGTRIAITVCVLIAVLGGLWWAGELGPSGPSATRLLGAPIVSASMLPGSDGDNLNGPSLIRAPDWIPDRLGRYYLYFAHHAGRYIRLAYADSLTGPWTVHAPGTLRLEQTACLQPESERARFPHLASPDVHVDDEAREIRMYFHCPVRLGADPVRLRQVTFSARSVDGLHFEAASEPIGDAYFRVFRWDGAWYALSRRGALLRSKDGLGGFAAGPTLLERKARHSAVAVRGHTLHVFYSRVGDRPERILAARVDLRADWSRWSASEPIVVLEPEAGWEGGDLPLEPSRGGRILTRVRQLRDPAVFEEDGAAYLLYSGAGEQAIGIARLEWE